MHRVSTVAELRAALRTAHRPVGLVLTMGALHAGHISLVRRARSDGATVVATIFVNPLQFGPNEDLERYPRPLERDLSLLQEEGVDLVFTPPVEEIYPSGFDTIVHVGKLTLSMEGVARPGHLDGVATVVAKLLIQSLPDLAYFGQKDAQQAAVVRRMVADLDLPVEVVVVPTVREPDGLAVSSRNVYLNPAQREAAPALFRALSATRDRFRSGIQDRDGLEAGCRTLLEGEPLIDAVDYVAVVDLVTMEPWQGRGACMLAAAVRFGAVRLIDNVVMD